MAQQTGRHTGTPFPLSLPLSEEDFDFPLDFFLPPLCSCCKEKKINYLKGLLLY